MEEIIVHDSNHIWYKGVQYISLKRFIELKRNELNEMEKLEDEIIRLKRENEAYKILLNNKEE